MKTNLEETLRSMVDAKTLNDERWTPYVVSGQQYWVRAVHYYGAWLISVVNLDRQCSQATDGMLVFAQPDGVLLAGTRPEEGELSHYINLTAETEGLVLEYYVPSTDMDLDNAMNLAPCCGHYGSAGGDLLCHLVPAQQCGAPAGCFGRRHAPHFGGRPFGAC